MPSPPKDRRRGIATRGSHRASGSPRMADDNAINRHILASLESAGIHVITAAGGVEAVEHACRYQPDVVLMDRRMWTRRVRSDETHSRRGGDRAIPVIAVSARFSDSHSGAAGRLRRLTAAGAAEVRTRRCSACLATFVRCHGAGVPPVQAMPSALLEVPSQAGALEGVPRRGDGRRRRRHRCPRGRVASEDVWRHSVGRFRT